MEKVVLKATFLLLLATFDYGYAQAKPRPVVPLSNNQSDPQISTRYVFGPSIPSDTLDSVVQDRDQSQTRNPATGQPVMRPVDQDSRRNQPQRMRPFVHRTQPAPNGINQVPISRNDGLKYPPPGSVVANTTAHNPSPDESDEQDTSLNVGADDSKLINTHVRQFALDMLMKMVIAKPEMNIVVSPFSVWSVLLAVLEGAGGNTAFQIKTSLKLPLSKHKIRKNFKLLDNALQISGKSVVFDSANALFSDVNRPVKQQYSEKLALWYHCSLIPLNFTNPAESVREVNKWVANNTHNRIKELIQKEDVENPELILANVVYFKGQWEWPFNTTATYRDTFFNERREPIADVQMMYQSGMYLYSFISELNAHVLDMPYKSGKFRMLLVLPKPTTTVRHVLEAMKQFPVDACYDRLVHEQQEYADDMVHVYVPKFKFKNKHHLGQDLQSMGMTDLFDQARANLTGINEQNGIYLAEVLHSAEIEVNEEGTVASAATGGLFVNKSGPLKFLANRPFIFFIVEDSQKTVIFAGRVYNPSI